MQHTFRGIFNYSLYYQPGAHEAHARLVPKIALCFCVCVCVCVRPQISHALSYVIPLLCHCSHERNGSYLSLQAQLAKVRQARLVLCCLDGERVVGNDDNSVCASSDR